jgi:hypothetical protein
MNLLGGAVRSKVLEIEVFISHSGKDDDFVDILAGEMEKSKITSRKNYRD